MLIAIMFAHFVGDFVCQTHWQASNKSKRVDALTRHVLVYSAVVTIGLAIMAQPSLLLARPLPILAVFFVATFVTHFVTDFVTSRINSCLFVRAMRQSDANPHWFFVGIGLDQFIHLVTLWLTLRYLFPGITLA